MNIRTDLIAEIKEDFKEEPSGVETSNESVGSVKISTVRITTDDAARILQKPVGTYCTVEFNRLDLVSDTSDIIKATVKALKAVTCGKAENALVIGLGNTDITPDALGPIVADRVLATRHLSKELKNKLGLADLKSVCCLSPNVIGKTGIESYDLITAVTNEIKPDTIIAVDALAARSAERLCRTVQISNSGICPGSGVNNARKELNKSTVGIPVTAVGIPTVIDANGILNSTEGMMVTPKEIDLLIEKSAQIVSRAINIFLQPSTDIDIIESLT